MAVRSEPGWHSLVIVVWQSHKAFLLAAYSSSCVAMAEECDADSNKHIALHALLQ
jgi:hypothetical protein